MYLHKEGKVAEYLMSDGVWFLKNKKYEYLFFPKRTDKEGLFESKEEAYLAAMDYHETEGCALYLELYPAPEKGDYKYIAQDGMGDWYGFESQPNAYKYRWDSTDYIYPKFIQSSPPNLFWRKTLR